MKERALEDQVEGMVAGTMHGDLECMYKLRLFSPHCVLRHLSSECPDYTKP